MLKRVLIKNLRPNPFRRLDEYPILREKVEALKDSIASTGFWGTIVGRPRGPDEVEIAFGHHRLVALQEGAASDDTVEIIVRELSNEDMLKMMARENMEEWGTFIWVELETIRSVIAAYGRGEIELPKVPKNAPEKREVGQGTGLLYTKSTVAEFLGWTRKHEGNGLRPNFACETAFKASDLIDAGLLQESQLKGLTRGQANELCNGISAIREASRRAAEEEAKREAEARERATQVADAAQRKRLEKQADIHKEQAEQHQRAAPRKAKDFGQEGAEMFQSGHGTMNVRQRAKERKTVVERTGKICEWDDMARRLAAKLEHIAKGDDDISAQVKDLKKNHRDLSQEATRELCRSFDSLIARLQRIRGHFEDSTRSHVDGTGVQHARRSLPGSRD